MKNYRWSFGLLIMVTFMLSTAVCFGATPEEVAEKIHWLGQASVKIEAGEQVVYIDPLQLKGTDTADIILITHGHDDHYSPSDIDKIVGEQTIFAAPQDVAERLGKKYAHKIIPLVPGQTESINGIPVTAVPAYNVKKTNFHPQKNNWVGYILEIDGVKVYHAGDTERIPEMGAFSCDIALLPLGQTYTMNSVQDAADAALDVQAKIAIPIHYGLYEGKAEDAETFKTLLDGKVTAIVKDAE